MFQQPDDMFHLDLLNVLATSELQESYPNIERALKTFLTMPNTIATAERSFSKLKIIKNFLRFTSGQPRTSSRRQSSILASIKFSVNSHHQL